MPPKQESIKPQIIKIKKQPLPGACKFNGTRQKIEKHLLLK